MFTTVEIFYLWLVPASMAAFAVVLAYVSVLSRGPFVGLRDLTPPKRHSSPETVRTAA